MISNSDATIIKDLGNDLYELSCYPVHCFMFSIDEYLPMDEVAGAGEALATWSTENMSFELCVGFTSKIIKVNHDLIDYTRENEGEKVSSYMQTDWVCVVQKLSDAENKNPYFRENYANNDNYHLRPLPCWIKNIGADLFELGYFSYSLPLGYYIRNIKILNENCKAGEQVCSFEYYPISCFTIETQKRLEYAEKYSKIGYLYAPYDLEKVIDFNPIFNPMMHDNPLPNNWILINIKEDFILKIKSKTAKK